MGCRHQPQEQVPGGKRGEEEGHVRQEHVEQLLKILGHKLIGDEQDPHDDHDHEVSKVEKLTRQSGRPPTGEPVTKSLGGAAFKNIRDKDPGKNKVHEKPEMRAVMGDITDTVVLNTEYEASIKVHQGREPNMDEKLETKEMMTKSNIDVKHDEINGNKSVSDQQERASLSCGHHKCYGNEDRKPRRSSGRHC